MSSLLFYDDAKAREFAPFTLTRPVSQLVAGALKTSDRWELISGSPADGFIADESLSDFDEEGSPAFISSEVDISIGSILINSRFIPKAGSREPYFDAAHNIWHGNGKVCAIRITDDVDTKAAFPLLVNGTIRLDDLVTQSHTDPTELEGRWMNEVWDFLGNLSAQLEEDIAGLAAQSPAFAKTSGGSDSIKHPPGYHIIGTHQLFVEDGATIEPYVIFDLSAGPVMVRKGATISAFSRVVGPCFIDRDAIVLGEMVANCSIGPKSKIRGEISSSIVLGFSNKGHAGFVGHSYLGKWVNLGAGTTTSNLKNTYGTVQLWTPTGTRNTSLQFIGTLFGDHVKTGIGTMLNTGTVLGCGANIYGAQMPPKYVPPFSWGDSEPYGQFDIDKFVDVARKVMIRRSVELSAQQELLLRKSFNRG